jgi:hypothetical protein
MSLFAVISAVATEAAEPDDDFVDLGDDDEETGFELTLAPPPPLAGGAAVRDGLTRREEKRLLRDANPALARDLARRTNLSHAKVNAELNKRAGLARISQATVPELQKRLRAAERWLTTVA